MTLEPTIPRDEWGDGPWQSEPDEARWLDAATGLQCIALRTPVTGTWCGYVGVPDGHAAYGLSHYFDDPEFDPSTRSQSSEPGPHPIEREAAERMARQHHQRMVAGWRAAQGRIPVQTMVNDISVHGGLTWSAKAPHGDATDPLWYFGFDTAHAGDYMPALEEQLRRIRIGGPPRRRPKEEYRTLHYVRAECARLARLLADIEQTVNGNTAVPLVRHKPSER